MNMNQCVFTGRITHTPELKTTPTGKSVCSFSIACENGYGDKKKVVFPTFVAWNGQAEFIAKLPKGTKVGIVAKYDERSWQTKNGDKRKAYEFIVSEVESHDPKRATDEPQQYDPPQASDFEEIGGDDDLPF